MDDKLERKRQLLLNIIEKWLYEEEKRLIEQNLNDEGDELDE